MEETLALLMKSHQGDKKARDTVFENNTGLIWSVVRRFLHRGVEAEELFQIGSIGLLKAIDYFDTSFQVKFSTYAVPMIAGEIKRFLRDDSLLKVGRSLKELSARSMKAREEMTARLGREPTIEELSQELETPKEEIVQAMEASMEVDSIYRQIYQEEGGEILLLDKLGETQEKEEHILDRIVLSQLLEGLGQQDRKLIFLRYFMGKTQTETGKQLGISQVQVSRAEKKILAFLREKGQKTS